MSDPLVRRDEVESAIAARRELGAGYDDELVDSLVEKIERRFEARQPTRWPGPPPAKPPRERHPSVTPLALGSILLGIPITAIALSRDGAGGIAVAIVAWIAIALVNIAYAVMAGKRR
jgi:hypothetical protein